MINVGDDSLSGRGADLGWGFIPWLECRLGLSFGGELIHFEMRGCGALEAGGEEPREEGSEEEVLAGGDGL